MKFTTFLGNGAQGTILLPPIGGYFEEMDIKMEIIHTFLFISLTILQMAFIVSLKRQKCPQKSFGINAFEHRDFGKRHYQRKI